MSATNRTENYNLPIFIETDKPAWLVDFNGAMRSIDAQMKANAEAIALKSPILTFQDTADIDFTKTGDIVTANLQSAITDKVGRALVTPLTAPTNEQLVAINTSGAQAALEIGEGLYLDNNRLHALDFNFNDINTYQAASFTEHSSGLTTPSGSITAALNATKTIGKIYGSVRFSGGTMYAFNEFYTGITVNPTGAEYFINGSGLMVQPSTGNVTVADGIRYRVSSTGKVYVQFWRDAPASGILNMFACIYFFLDFGDIPTPPTA